MKVLISIKKNKTRLISYIEIIAGIILLIFEVHDYITLYSTTEADEMFGGLVDFYKYKENTYSQFFLWTILLFTGISYWINKKLYWILTQTFLILLLTKIGIPFYSFFICPGLTTESIIPLLYLVFSIWIETKLLRINQIESINISIRTKLSGVLLGLLCCFIYLLLL